MEIINYLLKIVISLINSMLPVFNLPGDFLSKIDGALIIIIDLINGAAYFLPVTTLITCFTTILIFDNWKFVFRVGQWIIRLIRG